MMKSGKSFFNISGALIKLDLKRYWVLPLMLFVGYFLTGLFYLMVHFKDDAATASLIDMLLRGSYPVYSLITVAAPVIVSAIVFHYLNNMGPVMSVHSQPFSRYTLINSRTVSCALFCLIPVFATGLILLLMAHPVYYPPEYYTNPGEMHDLFARTDVLRWMLETSLISLFVLAICIFARMITGTGLHHVVAAVGFNMVLPILILLTEEYLSQYLYGYASGTSFSWITWTSPVMQIYTVNHFSPLTCLVYFLAALLIYALAVFLYGRRALERTGEGIVFAAFHYIITIIWGFLGMTFLGFIFKSIFGKPALSLFGYLAGAFLGVVICRMIIQKSLRVFDRTTMKIMGIFAVAALLFFGAIRADLTGYESRIPPQADSAKIEGLNYGMGLNGAGMVYENERMSNVYDTELVMDVHQYLVDRKRDFMKHQSFADYTAESGDPFDQIMDLTIRYFNGEECIQTRCYKVPVGEIITSDPVKKLLSSDSYRSSVKDSLPGPEQWHMIDLYNYAYQTPPGQQGINDREALASLYAAVCADLDAMTYEDIVSDCMAKEPVAYLELTYRSDRRENNAETETVEPPVANDIYNTLTLRVYADNENTLAWMHEHGNGLALNNPGYYNDLAVVRKIQEGSMEEFIEMPNEEQTLASLQEHPDTVTVVEDHAVMEQLYEEYEAVHLKGREVTTEQEDQYLVCFMNKDTSAGADDVYWLSTYGYISGDKLKSLGL
ncbi:MAG: hypothetical protein IKD85_02460 [Firmicutes bacterium]|nr:hypothetical protein [Bacillota bacterium]